MKKKRYFDDFEYEIPNKKPSNVPLSKEQKAGGFRCSHCRVWVVINPFIGTANRNHCNVCLWSRHVDEQKGDRKATCQGGMQPMALTFKHEGYGRVGELMLVHVCMDCNKISINRIAADDIEAKILSIFTQSLEQVINAKGIDILDEEDRPEVMRQLFGVQ